MLITV